MFTTVKMSAEEEIHRGLYASVVRTGKGNRRKNAYAVRKSRKQLVKFKVNKLYSAADVDYFSTKKLINRHRLGGKKMLLDLLHLFGILVWR